MSLIGSDRHSATTLLRCYHLPPLCTIVVGNATFARQSTVLHLAQTHNLLCAATLLTLRSTFLTSCRFICIDTLCNDSCETAANARVLVPLATWNAGFSAFGRFTFQLVLTFVPFASYRGEIFRRNVESQWIFVEQGLYVRLMSQLFPSAIFPNGNLSCAVKTPQREIFVTRRTLPVYNSQRIEPPLGGKSVITIIRSLYLYYKSYRFSQFSRKLLKFVQIPEFNW